MVKTIKKDEQLLNFLFQVFTHITWDKQNMFVSFRKYLDTDTPQTIPFVTPKHPTSCSKIAERRGTFGCKKG